MTVIRFDLQLAFIIRWVRLRRPHFLRKKWGKERWACGPRPMGCPSLCSRLLCAFLIGCTRLRLAAGCRSRRTSIRVASDASSHRGCGRRTRENIGRYVAREHKKEVTLQFALQRDFLFHLLDCAPPAKAAQTTSAAPAACSVCAAEDSVAPVVTMSSMSKTRLPANCAGSTAS